MRSLSKNKPVFEELLCEPDNFPDILAISETKLTDEKVICAKIPNYNFVFSNSSTNAGGVAFYILNSFSEIVNLHAPLRTLTRKELHLSTKPWISRSVLKSIQKKNAMFRHCYKKNDKILFEKYTKYSNILTSIKRLA